MTLLPPNSTPLMRAAEAAISRDLPVEIGKMWNPQTCPESALPWLAWALHITDSEGWAAATETQHKRDLLSRSFELHRQKGTVHSIKHALASLGFGPQSRLIEGGIPRNYDGTHFADGSLTYSSASWADYAIEADLGETSGLSAAHIDRIRSTCAEYAPVSRHLGNVTFAAHVSDSAPPAEQVGIELHLDGLSDITPWRRRYDGSLRYDQGIPLTYGGHLSANGTYLYAGGYAVNDSHWRAGDEETALDFSASLAHEDFVRRFAMYDGSSQADGLIDYGASAPCAEDTVMQIAAVHISDSSAPPTEKIDTAMHLDGLSDIVPWRRRYDGSLQYDQGIPLTYGGHLSANGTYLYAGGYAVNDSHWRAGDDDTSLDFSASLAHEDFVRRYAMYDGSSQANGLIDYGASAQCAEDAVVQIAAVHISDSAPPAEQVGIELHLDELSDIAPWRRRYDGSLRYDQGIPLTYGGHLSANGTYLYAGGYAVNDSHWRAGDEETALDFSASLTQEDYVRRYAMYDGSSQADGLIDYGASAPCAEDAVMQIAAVRRLKYNGQYRYNGALSANSGIHFLLEAA